MLYLLLLCVLESVFQNVNLKQHLFLYNYYIKEKNMTFLWMLLYRVTFRHSPLHISLFMAFLFASAEARKSELFLTKIKVLKQFFTVVPCTGKI